MKFFLSILIVLFFINVNAREGRYYNDNQSASVKHVYISEVLYNGSFVVLSDGSVWGIKPGNDQNIVYGWISPGRINIKNDNNSNNLYPYTLYNALTQDSVQAAKSSRKDVNSVEGFIRESKSVNSAKGREKSNLKSKKMPNKMKIEPKKENK